MVQDFKGYGCQVSICSGPCCSGESPARKVHRWRTGLELKLRKPLLEIDMPKSSGCFASGCLGALRTSPLGLGRNGSL